MINLHVSSAAVVISALIFLVFIRDWNEHQNFFWKNQKNINLNSSCILGAGFGLKNVPTNQNFPILVDQQIKISQFSWISTSYINILLFIPLLILIQECFLKCTCLEKNIHEICQRKEPTLSQHERAKTVT